MSLLRPPVEQPETIEDVIFPEPNGTGEGELPNSGSAAMLAIRLAIGLKGLRVRQGLQMKQVAARSGLDMATLSRLENGKIFNPRLDTLWRYAVAVGFEIEATLAPIPEEDKPEDDAESVSSPPAAPEPTSRNTERAGRAIELD